MIVNCTSSNEQRNIFLVHREMNLKGVVIPQEPHTFVHLLPFGSIREVNNPLGSESTLVRFMLYLCMRKDLLLYQPEPS